MFASVNTRRLRQRNNKQDYLRGSICGEGLINQVVLFFRISWILWSTGVSPTSVFSHSPEDFAPSSSSTSPYTSTPDPCSACSSKGKVVITALFHSAKTKRRSLGIAKCVNVCAHKAASIVASMLSVSRSRELPISPVLVQTRKCCSFPLCLNCWFVTSLNLSRISSFKRAENCWSGSVLVCKTCHHHWRLYNEEFRSQAYFSLWSLLWLSAVSGSGKWPVVLTGLRKDKAQDFKR